MNALKGISESVTLRLRSQSSEALRAVEKATHCIKHLHAIGCTVQQVTARAGVAVIDIDPPSSSGLTGTNYIARMHGSYREKVMVAIVKECQVQWAIREPLLAMPKEVGREG